MISGVLLIMGGLLFYKFSKASERVKKNVTLVLCLIGILSLIFNGPSMWRIINGTFDESRSHEVADQLDSTFDQLENALDDFGDQIDDFFDNLDDVFDNATIEIFNQTVNVFNLITAGSGLIITLIGVIYRKKKWGKWIILLGFASTLSGLLQIFLLN